MNVRKKLLWKLSTLALAFLLIAVFALICPKTSYGADRSQAQGVAWTLKSI